MEDDSADSGEPSGEAADTKAGALSAGASPDGNLPADSTAVCFIHVFLEEGIGMENLRAFMLTNSIKDYCSDFVCVPENAETDPATSDIIADQGFQIWFRTAEDRDMAMPAVKTEAPSGSIRR